MLGLFGKKSNDGETPLDPPVDIKWVRTPKGKFHNLMFLDTMSEGLDRVSGVYAVWKGGVKPQWLYAGSSSNLAKALDEFIDDPEMEQYFGQAGAFVSWALVKPEYQKGIVRYLNEAMKPDVENDKAKAYRKAKVPMIAVFLPGREKV